MNVIKKLYGVILAGACCLLTQSVIAANIGFPNTPAGRIAEQRLKAFNSGKLNTLQAYQKAHEPQMSVDRELALRNMTGGLEVLRLIRNEPNHVVVILREKDGDRVGTMELEVDAKQPERVLSVSLIPMAVTPEDLMPQRLSSSLAWQHLLHKTAGLVEQGHFAGTIAVGRNGVIRQSHSWGDADQANNLKNTTHTRFRIGSMYKMFTAVAVLQLVEQGRIALDAPLSRYLPDYPNAALATQVSIRQLLNHTGGTGDIFTEEYNAKRNEVREHADYLHLFGARAPAFTPGSKEEYSNYGYVLLGAVIERVTGKSYHEVVNEAIFIPVGMLDTGAEPEEKMREKISLGYTQSEHGWSDNRDKLPWRGTAAGGGYSTVGDLIRFGDALLRGRLLSKQWYAEATQPQAASGLYGYGFQLGGTATTRYFGHNGGAEGMNGALRIYAATGDVVVALSNMDPPSADSLVQYYANRMPLIAAKSVVQK